MSSINEVGVSTRCAGVSVVGSGSRFSTKNVQTETPSPVATQGRTCESCKLQEICLGGSSHDDRQFAPPLVSYRRHVKKDEVLYRSGAKCDAVYAIRAGAFKTTMFSEDGIGQITGFQMPGDLLGLDGIGLGKHRCDTVALSQGEVCVIPCANLIRLSHDNEALQARVLRALCDDIGGNHALMLLLGNRSAEERVVAFIVNLSDRLLAHGRPWSEFILWMTRAEIGSFLGLKLETVSRVFSKLDEQGLVVVQGRHIQIRDFDALRKLSGGDDHRAGGRRSGGPASLRSPLLDPESENAGLEACAAHRLARRIVEHVAAMSAATPARPAERVLER